MNDKGGVYVDLDEEERLKEEQEAADLAKEALYEELEKERSQILRRSELRWAYNLYILGGAPVIPSLITLFVGPIILKISPMCTTRNLHQFVQMSIGVAYLYLFLYAWMLFGPYPFKSRMRPLKWIFFFVFLIATGAYGYGVYLIMDGASGCYDEAPTQFRYCMMQIVFYILGIISVVYRFALFYYKNRHRKASAPLAPIPSQSRREPVASSVLESNDNDDNDEASYDRETEKEHEE